MQTLINNRHPIRMDDPCVLFAMGRESGKFRDDFPPHLAFEGAPCWARFCGPSWLSVLVVETGIGPANVSRAMDWLLAKPQFEKVPYDPKVIIYAGFAGALTDKLQVGDIVLADEVVDEHGNSWRTTWPTSLPEGRWDPPLHRGRLLMTEHLLGAPDEKRRLAQEHQAIAVDMESATFAARCARAGIPFGCVRAISDAVDTPLSPGLVTLLEGGSISVWRAVKALARQPSMLPEFLRLARHTNRASHELGRALGELLTLTLPWEL